MASTDIIMYTPSQCPTPLPPKIMYLSTKADPFECTQSLNFLSSLILMLTNQDSRLVHKPQQKHKKAQRKTQYSCSWLSEFVNEGNNYDPSLISQIFLHIF